MTASVWAWLAAAGVLALLDWLAVARSARRLELCARPGVLGCLLVAAALASPSHVGVHGWLVAALALGLAGNIALVWHPIPAVDFAALVPTGRSEPVKVPRLPSADHTNLGPGRLSLLGLLSFLLGHICYSIAMMHYGTDRLSVTFGLILALITLFAFGYRIIAGANAIGGSLLTFGVTVYIVALGSAVVFGVGTAQLWVAYGIVLFAVSDLALATDRFVQARPWAPVTVSVTYHLAQMLLLIGLIH